ncbi:hypothetical protein SBA4_5890012 [Candidatus Sulfopaludibacter sp. SbA4]|nr:hypothetical protein SBA4_5890012 [Candidatus Sulfopaludibacter sp. SbA4]
MTEVVIAMTGAAADLGRLAIHNRHDRVVHDPFAADAKVVDIVAQAGFAHKGQGTS